MTLESGPSASGLASDWVRGLAQREGLTEERAYGLDLCVIELVSNVVDHSYRGSPGQIRLEVEIDSPTALLTVIDDGPEFDPLSVPAPRATSLDDAPIGGYGVQLVRSMASDCCYERREGRNVFTAAFRQPDHLD